MSETPEMKLVYIARAEQALESYRLNIAQSEAVQTLGAPSGNALTAHLDELERLTLSARGLLLKAAAPNLVFGNAERRGQNAPRP